jgi:hypothetical protein
VQPKCYVAQLTRFTSIIGLPEEATLFLVIVVARLLTAAVVVGVLVAVAAPWLGPCLRISLACGWGLASVLGCGCG